MRWMRRLLNVFRPDRLSRDLDRELEFHVAERADELRARGMDDGAAVREARRMLGNYVIQKERTRDMDILVWLDTVRADVRYAGRTLRRSPGFSIAAVLSLALGIGANTAIFSLLDAAVLRTLPVHAPDELVQVTLGDKGDYFTNPLWEELRDRQQVFAAAATYTEPQFNLSNGGVARPIQGSYVSGDFFSMLGVGAAAGRVLSRSDDYRGCPPVTVLGAGFWRSEYGGSPDAVGRTLQLDGKPFEIVGVAAESFRGVTVGRSVQAYVPLCAEAVVTGVRSALDARSTWFLQVLARPRAGLPLASINAQLAGIGPAAYAATVPQQYDPDMKAAYVTGKFAAVPAAAGVSELREQYSRALLVLMGLVGIVLLIACANVANLMLARAAAREREINVRLAIGAGRGRIVRQLLTESLLIALMSALLGVLFAVQGSRILVALLSTGNNPVSLDLPLDGRVLGFTLTVAVCAALLFGLAPSWRASRSDPQSALRAAGRNVISGHSRFNTGKALVAAQIALSLALVVSAGLLVGTFRTLSTSATGFDRTNVMLVRINLPIETDTAVRRTTFRTILDDLRSSPQVESAALTQLTPVSRRSWNDLVFVDGFVDDSHVARLSFMNEVSDGYFATLGTRLLAGREFDARDTRGAARVIVVNEEFARHFFGTASVVGREVRIGADDTQPFEIVGVAETAKLRSLREEPERVAYVAMSQAEQTPLEMSIVLRSRTAAAEVVPVIAATAAAADPSAALRMMPLAQQISDSLTRERVLAMLSGAFGTLALILATIGLYGVMAYNVARRRSEIGIRMALGSARGRVLRMVLAEAGWLIGAGLALGAALALAGTRFVQSFLYGLSPDDATTLLLSAALLGGAGFAACALPAWRASRVEPMSALREE